MATAAETQPTPTTTDPVQPWLERRTATNRANSQHSTGPRTESGKQRSSQNALRHGLTARTAVLPTEDPEAYQRHIQQFLDEYHPANATETQLVHELANTSWRLNRIPFLEAELLSRATNPPTGQAGSNTQETPFDIVDAHCALATLGLHGSRLSRRFQNALQQLRYVQEAQRARRAPPNGTETASRRPPFCASSPGRAAPPGAPSPHQSGRNLHAPSLQRTSLAACRRLLRTILRTRWLRFFKEQVERHARHLMRLHPVHYAPFTAQWDRQQPAGATI